MGSLFRSILSVLSGRVAHLLLGLAFTPILVRLVSQEQYGIYASVIAGITVVSLVAKGGLFDATRKIVAEHTDEPWDVSIITSTALLLSLAYGSVAVATIALGIRFGLVPAKYTRIVWVLLAAVFFGNVLSIARGVLYGLQNEHLAEALGVSRRLFYSITGLTLAYLGHEVWGVFTGYSSAYVLFAIFGLAVASRYVSITVPSIDDVVTHGREIAQYGGYQLLGGVSFVLLYKVDVLLVEFFKGSESTAIYNSAIVPAEMIWFVPFVIQLSFLQHTATLWSNDDIEQISENIRTGLKYAILSLTLFGVGLFGLSESFLTLYFGETYLPAANVLRILILGTFFFGASRVLIPVFEATDRVREAEGIVAGALVLNVLLNTLLIPRYGILGAGIGTTVSYVSIFVGNVALWARSPFEMVSPSWLLKLLAVQMLFAGGFLALVSTSEFSPLVSLLVFPPVGLGLFVAINVSAGYISPDQIKSQLQSEFGFLG